MSIFDNLNKGTSEERPEIKPIEKVQKTEIFTFKALPESLEEMKALEEAKLETPFQAAALTVCALCAYAAAPEIGKDMLNFLRGPRPVSNYDISFLKDRFMDVKTYIPFSYFEGAKPENDYNPSQPFKLTIQTNPYSYEQEGYCKLFIQSGGADSMRFVVLRQKGDGQWCLWEQHLLSGIREPKSQDPWA